MLESFAALVHGIDLLFLRAEAEHVIAEAALDHLVQIHKGAAADEQDVAGVDADVFLLRMLATALRRHGADGAFQNLEQRLLHAFTGNIACDRNVFGAAGDLVDLVDINDAHLRALHVVVRGLQQTQDNVFYILTHITGLGQGGGVGDGKRHIEHAGEGAGEQGLAGAGGADEHDVGLFNLHAGMRGILGFGGGLVQDAFVVIVHSDGQRLLGGVLPDTMLVQLGLDLGGLLDGQLRRLALGGFLSQLLVEHLFEGFDAFVAYVHPRAGHQLADFGMRFAAEAAQGEIARAGHGRCRLFLVHRRFVRKRSDILAGGHYFIH